MHKLLDLLSSGRKSPGFYHGHIVVASAFFIATIMWGSLYAFGVFFEPLLAEFGWTRATTSGAFSLSLVVLGFLGILSGRLCDRFGPRIVVTVSSLFLGLGYSLMSQVSAVWQIYLYYGVLVGTGMSGCVVPLLSTVARWFIKKRGVMSGVVLSGIGAGTLIMPPVANWLISIYGWRNSYLVLAIIVFILVLLSAQFLRTDGNKQGQLLLDEKELPEKRGPFITGLSLQEAICTRQFWLIGSALFFFTSSLGAIIVHVVPHAIGLGVSATNATIILSIIGGVSIVGRVIMGSFSDRFGYKVTGTFSLSCVAFSLFWLLVAEDLWMLYLFAAIFGFGYGGFTPLVSPMVAEYFGLGSHGVILGTLVFGSESGNAIGPVITGYIFDVTDSYYPSFVIFALITILGICLILLLKPTQANLKSAHNSA